MIKNKRILVTFMSIVIIGKALAQIGINTDHPLTDLDVNGNTRIAGNLLVGGSDDMEGFSGTKGMLLISQGEGLPPQWKTISLNNTIEDQEWYLAGTISKIDNGGGITLSTDYETGSTTYNKGLIVERSTTDKYNWKSNGKDKYWREFKDMVVTIPASDKPLRVMLNLQIPVQAYWEQPSDLSLKQWISCTFGVFEEVSIDQLKLVASIQGGCFGSGANNTPTITLSIITAVDVAPRSNTSKLHILGTRRACVVEKKQSSVLYMGTDTKGSQSERDAFNHLTIKVDILAHK